MSEQHKWKPGESGNPNGRPRNLFSLNKELTAKLGEVNPRDPRGRTWARILVDDAVRIATTGRPSLMKMRAIAEIWDRVAGKPVQAVAVADLRPESREQLIESILETVQALKEDESTTIQ